MTHAPKPDTRRTAYNWIYRVLDDRTKAKAFMGRLPAESLDGAPVQILPAIRQVLVSDLDAAAFEATIFGRPREMLVDLPPLRPLPAGAQPGEVPDPREDFAPAVRGVIELCLVDRLPLDIVAAHLEVGPDIVRSFLASVLDLLGELTAISLAEGAQHVTRVIQEEIDVHQGMAPPPPDLAADPAVAVRQRCREVLAVLAQDKRIFSMSSDQLVKKALAAPKAQVASRRGWIETAFKGLTPRAPRAEGPDFEDPDAAVSGATPAPPPRGPPWKPILTGLGAISLITGLMIFGGSGKSTPAGARMTGGDPARVLGTFSTPGHRRQPLMADSRLEAPASGPLAASWYSGGSVVGSPPSALRVLPGAVELGRGTFKVRSEWKLKTAFVVRIRTLKIEVTDGTLDVAVSEQGMVRVTGVKGRSILSEPADQTREIAPGDRLELTAEGTLTFAAAPG